MDSASFLIVGGDSKARRNGVMGLGLGWVWCWEGGRGGKGEVESLMSRIDGSFGCGTRDL